MVAHQMIGGGIADALVERGRALEIGEHQGHLGDGDLIARPQHIAAEEIAEGLERRQPVGGEAIAQPAAILDDGDPRPVAAVDQRDLARRGEGARRHRIGGHDQLGKAAARILDGAFRSRLQGAQPIGTRRQGRRDAARLPGLELDLQLDMRRRHGAEEAIFAALQLAQRRRRAEARLDVLREIGVVIDVAGGAMGALGQAVQGADPGFGDPAARAEQIPAHLQEPRLHRLQAGLDGRHRRRMPLPGQGQRADMPEIDLLPLQHQIGEAARHAMAMGRGLDLTHEAIDPAKDLRPRGRRLELEGRLALAADEGSRVAHHLRVAPLGAGKETRRQHDAPQPVGGRRLHRIVDAAAVAFRRYPQAGAEKAERPAGEIAAMLEPLAEDPIDRLLAPGQGDGPDLGAAEEKHRAVGLGDLLDLMARQLGGLVEPGRIGQHRPHGLGGPIDMPAPSPLLRLGHGSSP